MDSITSQIGIIGGGSWATAIAKILLERVPHIHWYQRNARRIEEYGALRKCSYFINNLYHRLDGPAIEWYENDNLIDCSYYINGKKIKDEFIIAIIASIISKTCKI